MGNLKNFATALVATAPSPATSGTSLVVEAAKGTRFPAVPFYATAHPKNEIPTLDNAEAVLVTGRSTDTLTIVRAQKGTTAKTITTDFRISNTIFTEDMFNGSVVYNEVPGGTKNSVNTAFTLATAGLVTGSLEVYLNGQRLLGGGADYTEGAAGFTMVVAPDSDDVLVVDYRVGGTSDYSVGTNSTIINETPAGVVNGSTTLFTAARAYIAGSLGVYINGIKQKTTTHFAETNPSAGTFTMTAAPETDDDIMIDYLFNLNPSSNADTTDGLHASDVGGVTGQLIADYYGWQKFPANVTFTYSSADAPVYVLGTNIDLRGYIGLGDKLWLTHSSTSKYFIVVAITSSTITVLAPVGTTLAATAITAPYFSHVKNPFGFPMNDDLWMVEYVSTSNINTGSIASSATITNFTGHQLAIPIGWWEVEVSLLSAVVHAGTSYMAMSVALSTANNTFSNTRLLTSGPASNLSAAEVDGPLSFHKSLVLTSKTTYYLNTKASVNNATMYAQGAVQPTVIRATCKYL